MNPLEYGRLVWDYTLARLGIDPHDERGLTTTETRNLPGGGRIPSGISSHAVGRGRVSGHRGHRSRRGRIDSRRLLLTGTAGGDSEQCSCQNKLRHQYSLQGLGQPVGVSARSATVVGHNRRAQHQPEPWLCQSPKTTAELA